MPISITLTSPGEFDISGFAESTRTTLVLLAPWCRLQDSQAGVPVKEIVTRSLEYVGVINLSIAAAQAGFTVAEEVISLADIISTSTVPERLAYLKGMWELVKEARTNAEKTHQTFRNIRQEVYSLTEQTKGQMSDTSVDDTRQRSVEASIAELRDGVAVLETFADHISNFVDWWDWMKMESSTPQTQQQNLTYYHASLNDKAVIRKWRELKAQYAAYTDMIGQMQDAYPDLFLKSMNDLEQQQRDPQQQQERLRQEPEKRDQQKKEELYSQMKEERVRKEQEWRDREEKEQRVRQDRQKKQERDQQGQESRVQQEREERVRREEQQRDQQMEEEQHRQMEKQERDRQERKQRDRQEQERRDQQMEEERRRQMEEQREQEQRDRQKREERQPEEMERTKGCGCVIM